MTGIWALPVHLTGASFSDSYILARIIIDIVFFVLIIYPWLRLTSNPSPKKKFDKIKYGALIILLWFVSTITDLFLHEAKLKTQYSYILYEVFLSSARYAADIFVLAGTLQLVSEQLTQLPMSQLSKNVQIWKLAGELIVLVQTMLALYFLGSLCADEVLWLQIADPSIIDGVSSHRDKFEASFFIIQFLLTFTMLIGSATSVWYWRKEGESIPNHVCFSAAITSILWVRCFAELVIVIRYHYLHHGYLRSTYIARDTVYGLCSFIFFFLVDLLARDTSSQGQSTITPAKIQEETRLHLISVLESAILDNQRAPDFRDVVQTLQKNPDTALSNTTIQGLNNMSTTESARLRRLHQDYLVELKEQFGNLRR